MTPDAIDAFINRWQAADGKEIANTQPFVAELCDLLGVERPRPASRNPKENAYVFERSVTFHNGDGTESIGRIDLYKQGCFVLESKSLRQTPESSSWKGRMLRAHGQASQYVRALPADEGRPPFILLLDVGQSVIEVHSEFSRTGGAYVPFPDPRSHRVTLDDLRDEGTRDRLRMVWTDPLSLDPSRQSAKVTKEIAGWLARLAEQLEQQGKDPDAVASFLMRCLFTMFAEDTKLLPENSFTRLLQQAAEDPRYFARLLTGLWTEMDRGGFSALLRADILKFNGGLFADHDAIELTREQILLLQLAAESDWREVEPAIFGTLLERALDPDERHRLGAHYTPRSYVERLVMPTIIEPLRGEWAGAQAAAVALDRQGKHDEAVAELLAFRDRLVHVRVLDPACGSGNFLYVTLEHLKRLEGEVLNTLAEFGFGEQRFETAGLTVDPRQMLGIEKNPRAVRIAEAVLWIGYLQWHFRTRGDVNPPQPVLKDYKNIEHRDALLDWDKIEYVTDERSIPKVRWDGKKMKTHPVTGEQVPDESGEVVEERYVNPRQAVWPDTDFVVGNPPFLGARTIRGALGSGYLSALRQTYPEVPEHCDYVMYWWEKAAKLVRSDRLSRFGLITTNSIRQSFSRKILEQHLLASNRPIQILMAVPDHPWVDATDGAAVRIAMTVGGYGKEGALYELVEDKPGQDGERVARFGERKGLITPGLRVGIDFSDVGELRSNFGISCVGYQLTGQGFLSARRDAQSLDRFFETEDARIRPLLSGRDITKTRRERFAIDVFGYSESDLRTEHGEIYQWLRNRVKPERDQNNHESLRTNWWIFGRARSAFRPSLRGLGNLVVTSLTAKHRFFVLMPANTICDSTTVMFALDDPHCLGTLSSRAHVAWALAAGGRLGVGNDPATTRPAASKPSPSQTPPKPNAKPSAASPSKSTPAASTAKSSTPNSRSPACITSSKSCATAATI